MDLYSYVSIESFVRGCKESKTPGTFTLHVPNLLYAKSDEVIGYGLSLLRRSIVLHEEQKGIGPELSKQNIPFSGRTAGCLSDRRWRCTLFPFTRIWKSLPV